ncbi:hypothetical protein K458DRAFT_277039, partial [Lentithecium fluviatile CBS 122367]
IAGAAVGITSLGIQVCEHLIRYYKDYRSFDDAIDSVVKRIEGLKENLKILKLVGDKVANPNDPNDIVLKQTQQANDTCEDGVKQLEKIMKGCRETKIPGSWQDKVKLVRNKFYWPFKDTLMDLQDTVDRLQENLQLAVDALGMQGGVDALSTSHRQQTMLTNSQMTAHGIQLQDQTQTLHSIQGGISFLSLSQRDLASSMNARIASEALELRSQVDAIAQQLALVLTQTTKTHGLVQVSTGLLEDSLAAYRDVGPSFRRNLRNYNRSIPSSTRSNVPDWDCGCALLSRRQESHRCGWFSFTISSFHSDHLPTCPRFPHADFSHIVEKQYTYCTRLFRGCFKVGYVHAREAGWRKIYPMLSLRAVVPHTSPVFQTFKEAE